MHQEINTYISMALLGALALCASMLIINAAYNEEFSVASAAVTDLIIEIEIAP